MKRQNKFSKNVQILQKILRNPSHLALICAIAGAFLGVLNNTLGKYLAPTIDPLPQTVIKLFWAIITLSLVFSHKISLKHIRSLQRHHWMILITLGICGWALSRWFILEAAIRTSIAQVALIESTLPLLVYLLVVLFTKESFNPRSLIYITLTCYGVLVITSRSLFVHIGSFGVGELLAFVSTFFLSYSFVTRRYLSSVLNTVEIIVVSMVFGFIVLLGSLFFYPFPLHISLTTHLQLAFTGVILAASLLCGTYSLKHMSAHFVGQISLTRVIFGFLLGFIFFHESISLTLIIGTIIIVFSAFQSYKLLK